jgi:hypothetical protein
LPPPKQSPPPPPPPPAKSSANGARTPAPASRQKFSVSGGISTTSHRIVIFGSGGVGKTELCANLGQIGVRPMFLDIGNGTGFLDVKRVKPTPENWEDLRAALHTEELWAGCDAVVLDDLTKAQEMAEKWVIDNIPVNGDGGRATSIESFGFGKGLIHVYEAFLLLLGDLDMHFRAGRHVICISHECTANVPNPSGTDWIRYEPRLQSPASGKSSIRHRVKEWADHLLFIGFDTFVKNDGKAKGGGTRTIYPTEMPVHWAKSRSLSDPIAYERGSPLLWQKLFQGA